MNFLTKYPVLKNRMYLRKLLTETVFTTMALENQLVSRSKIEQIVDLALQEGKSPTEINSELIRILKGS